jgi:hypothetical protein
MATEILMPKVEDLDRSCVAEEELDEQVRDFINKELTPAVIRTQENLKRSATKGYISVEYPHWLYMNKSLGFPLLRQYLEPLGYTVSDTQRLSTAGACVGIAWTL